jgi:ATP-dependent Lon protease
LVLPVGGIKEKVLAAKRLGIREIILPKQNERNVNEDLTTDQKRDLTVHYVQEMDDVLALALLPPGRRGEATRSDESRPRFSLA